MINPSQKMIILSLAAVTVFAAGLIWSGKATLNDGFVSSAEARIGRPLTPMSYAGVARRTTRRAVVYGGAGAAAAPRARPWGPPRGGRGARAPRRPPTTPPLPPPPPPPP